MSFRRIVFVCVVLALITMLSYLPVRHYEFINYDDGVYVTENPTVQAGMSWAGAKWAFSSWHANFWHPVTWLSHMLDCQLFGLDAGKHHVVNATFHTLNAILLFLLVLRMTGALWQSALVAALFAWHPLRVKSVAWVAERKDVLSAFFGLLTLTAYVRYAQRRSRVESRESSGGTTISTLGAPGSILNYALALLFFALGLMAKPMLVTLPFVFLLLDYWPLERVPGFKFQKSRLSRLIWEKWPFFALTAAFCVLTYLAQRSGEAVVPLEWYPLDLRIENAVVSYGTYLWKTIWPANLAVFYPRPTDLSGVQLVPAVMALVGISWWIWRAHRRRPYLLTGWLWFLGTLVPVIGLTQVGIRTQGPIVSPTCHR